MWTFTINETSRTTELRKDGILVSNDGYSGSYTDNPEIDGFNNPSKVALHEIGPIPCGMWDIAGPPYDHLTKGKYVIKLYPEKETEMYGRSGLLLHGKPLPPRDILSGSDGCICEDHITRVRVYQSGDTKLQVIYINI